MIELSIVIPTYNESENIKGLIYELKELLNHQSYEIIVVDDNSSDCTADIVREIARQDTHVRCIQRIGRRGLSSACMEGFLSSSADYIAVMDADGQHDANLLPEMLNELKSNNAEVVNASRYMEGGSTGELAENRVMISKVATWAANLLLFNSITDPMSGFFMFKVKSIAPTYSIISAQGFKILLDILVNIPSDCRIKELPYKMKSRIAGKSKLDFLVVLDFFWVFVEKLSGYKISRQFVSFIAVGMTGLFVHMLILGVLHNSLEMDFAEAQVIAIVTAMTSNFFLNNQITYKQQRLVGMAIISGLFSFYLACTLGAIINWQFSKLLFESHFTWWLAGAAGAVVGAVWNYTMTRIFTWKN